MIVTYPDHTIRNIPDLIKTAKSRAEPLLCGVPGAGTPQHLLIEYFCASPASRSRSCRSAAATRR